jgi:hypothetical protein
MNTHTRDLPGDRPTAISAGRGSNWRPRIIGIVGAVLLAELVWVAATRVGGLDIQAPASQSNPQPASIGPLAAGLASLVASLLAWGLAAGVRGLTRRSRGAWLALAVLGLAVSLVMPLSGWGVSMADRLVLVSMHVAVAAVVVPLLYCTWPPATSHSTEST